MIRAARLPFDVTKEIRALSGAWLLCLVAMVVAAALSAGEFHLAGIGPLAYFLGCAAVGSLSIGHEYSHGTLTLLLSQPARREHIFLSKMGVLAAMLLTLGAVARAGLDSSAPESMRLAFVLLPMLCGLFIAPWLTMLCRSPIAGTVFTFVPPGWLWVVSERVYVAAYGREPATDVAIAIVWTETLSLCALGAVMSWRMFMRLEAIDGRGPEVHVPQWLRRGTTTSIAASTLTKRHPVWLLVKKDIRLQQMALAVAGVYVLGCLTFVMVMHSVPHADDVFTALTFFYGASMPVLIGSLASAEERQLGTLEWQVLLPLASWKQWTVKVGTASGLALLLALGLPGLLLASIDPGVDLARFFRPQMAVGVAALTVVSLYVSTLCTSGLRALLMSVSAICAVVFFVGSVVQALVSDSGFYIADRLSGVHAWERFGIGRFGISPVDYSRLMNMLEFLVVVAVLAMVSRFALANHRSADPAGGRVWRQVTMVAVGLAVGAIVLAGMATLS